MGVNIVDEIDCGNLFDQIEDLMDFPLDDNECGGGDDGKLVSSIDGVGFPSWNDALADCDPFLSSGHINSASDLSAELSVPYEDILQLEWLSTFVEDSFSSAGLTLGKSDQFCAKKEPTPNQFQISSPLSVLESTTSSSSSSGGKTMPPLGPQRARSKRPRPATFNPRPAIQLVSPSSSGTTPNPVLGSSSEPDCFAESPPGKKKIRVSQATNKARKNRTGEEECKKKTKKTKTAFPTDPPAAPVDGAPVRKCLHCQITKTPQWRGGPNGPKTLCNACGVRYKSGRLFPEYRPAASPTFVPSLHSNSHKKVVEMRSKVGPGDAGVEQVRAEDMDVVVPNA